MLKVKDIQIGKGMPKIIVPLTGETDAELIEEAKLVKELKPDMVEWRADKFKDVKNAEKVKKILHQLAGNLSDTPLIFTFRTIKEGGDTAMGEDEYAQLIQVAMESGNIDLVDIEYTLSKGIRSRLVSKAKEYGVFIIMSSHHFDSTPAEQAISSTLMQMIKAEADISKLAVMPQKTEDVITLLQATNTIKKQHPDQPLITMAMGKYGLISRLAGEVFGSDATFGVGREASAPGQINVSDLREVLRIIHHNS
ncbi:type I 3-dehydroquinate dehydratase [Virgibacillus kimchii]